MALSSVLNAKPQAAAEDTAAFGPIAERFRRAGDLERAVSLCRDGLQKFPQHISARVTLGWALLDLSKYDEARTELEQALRRAPDNLAAIRGLAELHDRSEHTLHLPMDGPGQWPPDAVAVEKAAATSMEPVAGWFPAIDSPDEPVLLTAVEAEEEDPEFVPDFLQAGPAVLTSAELGSAVWSSAPPPAESAATPIAEPVTAPIAESVTAPIAEPVTAPVVESMTAPIAESVVTPAAEPAPSIAEPVAMPIAEPVAAVEPLLVSMPTTCPDPIMELEDEETSVVSEADIAALIAEADSLEAAAESGAAEPPLVLDAAMDLGGLDDVALDLPSGLTVPPGIEIADSLFDTAPSVFDTAETVGGESPALAFRSAKHAHIAEVVSLARVAGLRPVRSPVAALERFLARVQARRQQLMAESVA